MAGTEEEGGPSKRARLDEGSKDGDLAEAGPSAAGERNGDVIEGSIEAGSSSRAAKKETAGGEDGELGSVENEQPAVTLSEVRTNGNAGGGVGNPDAPAAVDAERDGGAGSEGGTVEAELDDQRKETEKLLDQLVQIQDELTASHDQENDEILALQRHHIEQRKPLFDRRAQVISSIAGNFWAVTLANHPILSDMLTPNDRNALNFMVGLEVDDIPGHGCTIIMHFGENPYFSNARLEKRFDLQPDGKYHVVGSAVEWKPNMNLLELAAQPGSDADESFFKWFNENDTTQADEVCDALKDDIWPDPLKMYLGVGNDAEVGEGEEDVEEEDVGEDIDPEDEGEDDEEEEEDDGDVDEEGDAEDGHQEILEEDAEEEDEGEEDEEEVEQEEVEEGAEAYEEGRGDEANGNGNDLEEEDLAIEGDEDEEDMEEEGEEGVEEGEEAGKDGGGATASGAGGGAGGAVGGGGGSSSNAGIGGGSAARLGQEQKTAQNRPGQANGSVDTRKGDVRDPDGES